eukprot:919867-Prorocentrum_lima.AAC.1
MTSSLVGSEMCIRDRLITTSSCPEKHQLLQQVLEQAKAMLVVTEALTRTCLLYTSDAADDM